MSKKLIGGIRAQILETLDKIVPLADSIEEQMRDVPHSRSGEANLSVVPRQHQYAFHAQGGFLHIVYVKDGKTYSLTVRKEFKE
jgi:hypothetical protein